MNKCIFSGYLAAPIELSKSKNDKEYTRFSLAVRKSYKEGNEYKSMFVDCIAWGQRAKYLYNYATKGSKLIVEGELESEIFTKQDGTKTKYTQVICSGVEICSTKSAAKVELAPAEDDLGDLEPTASLDIKEEDLPFF